MPVENLMVNDDHWRWQEKGLQDAGETLAEKGYHETNTNVFVADEEAYGYAIDRCMNGSEEEQREFKEMLVEWFYSGGNWRREE